MTYLVRRNALYYLNLRLPKHLFSNRQTLRLSLEITDRQAAHFMASQLVQRIFDHLDLNPDTQIQELRQLCLKWRQSSAPVVRIERAQRSLSPTPPTPVSALAGPKLSELSKQYLEEGKRGGTWRLGSFVEVERALGDLFDLIGDMPIQAFDKATARLLKERLSLCPQYFALRPEFAGKTLLEVVESGGEYKKITAVTVNNRLRKLNAFMNWCTTNGYLEANPLLKIRVMTGSAKEARISFEANDLRKLLDVESLKQESTKHPWRYWLPLLGRTTGARIEELSQLKVPDILEIEGIWCLRIDDEGEGQQLKTSASRRVIPIHSKLLELGFGDYVRSLQAPHQDYIFPELEPVRGKRGHAPSKWFSRYKQKLGITDLRKTFHSFRHTLIDDLGDLGAQDSLIKRIVGHEDSSVTFGIYGSRTPINAMREVLEKIDLLETSS